MSYKWPGIPNGDYSFDHGRAVWNRIINFLRRLCEKLDGDLADATSDRRGLMTAEDKAALDAVPDTYVRKAGDTVTGNINSLYGANGTDTVNQFSGEMAGDDLWAIRTGITGRPDPEGAATGDNGFLEIATGDNGTEPIYISQYIGDHILPDSQRQGERFYQLHRSATLLDEQGNTFFPGMVTALSFNGTATRANYATSAGTAAKLGTSDVGSATQPIYLEGGVATACTYQLYKTVPADAKFTDTVYTHPTYTARTGKPTQDQTPAFGGTVMVSQVESDGTGHVTGMIDRTITIPATEASQGARGLMSSADKTILDNIPNTYVPLSGNSTISGSITLKDTAQNGTFLQIATDLTRGNVNTPVVKAAYKYAFMDEYNHIICGIYSRYDVTGPNDYYNRVGLYAFNPSTTGNDSGVGNNNFAAIIVGKNQNGSFTSAPTPPSNDDSNQIATTEWVRDYGDTITYTHPTTPGNKHIPSGGSSGQILRWSADGTAVWGADQDTTYGLATQNADGLLSASDKTQIDNLGGNINLVSAYPFIGVGDTSKYLRLFGGSNEYSGGASIYLNGATRSPNTGTFGITAHNGTSAYSLSGAPDGKLTWGGHNVLTDAVSYAKVADLPSSYTSVNFSSVSVPNATFTNLGSFTPSKTGKWLIIINVSIDANANGYRRLVIANSTTGNYPDRFRYIHTDGTTANSTLLQLSWLWNCTSISTVYFNVYQTSSVALNATGGYRAYYLGG